MSDNHSPCATALLREDVEFASGKETCRAWLYTPASPQTHLVPCIVMAHGFGATRECGLEPYAEKFTQAGYMVLVFDYRHFGASTGEPRQLFSVRRQPEDWANAISFARSIKNVDPDKIALWGSSFSGGHVIVAAAADGNIAAISSQCPMMDARMSARASFRHSGFFSFMKQGMLAMADQIGSLFGRAPIYVPLTGKPGTVAAMNSQDSVSGYGALTPPDWRNEVCARYVLTITSYRPITFATKLNCPALIQVCMNDSLAPAATTIRAAQLIGDKAQLERYDCGHFDIYQGKHYKRASSEQLAFFDRVLKS